MKGGYIPGKSKRIAARGKNQTLTERRRVTTKTRNANKRSVKDRQNKRTRTRRTQSRRT